MDFLPLTEADRAAMLARLGLGSVDQLFEELVPENARYSGDLGLPEGLSEWETLKETGQLAAANRNCGDLVCFLGGGCYDHAVPAVVADIVSRSEFSTSYTPYQPEMSQGMLQATYEYQSMICELTGLDVSNASLYDGASALAEAVLLALRATGRNRVILSEGVHPHYRMALRTYLRGQSVTLEEVGLESGRTGIAGMDALLGRETAAVVVQNPNFFGCLEPMAEAAGPAQERGALFVSVVDPLSLGVLAEPGSYGADVAVGEGQGMGLPMSYGGPYLGFLAARREYLRLMPGRLAGRTVDNRGQIGYVLTLQTREQHIRRARATSNICTNQALCALAAAVYLAHMGPSGLRELGETCRARASYLARRLSALKGCSLPFPGPYFREFVVRVPDGRRALGALLDRGILGGIPLWERDPSLVDCLLVAVTEKRTREELDDYADVVAAAVG